MKISFSTLGCPDWTWDEMLATAKDFGYNGIEVRGIENELYIPLAKPFLAQNSGYTKDRLKAMGLEIPCLTSSCYLFDENGNERYLTEGREYVSAAAGLGVPYIRVLGDKDPAPSPSINEGLVLENLINLAEYAEQYNVTVLIETNGVFADSGKLLQLIKRAGHKNIAVLWDIHHPFRYMGEPVEKTYDELKDYIKLVHVKDSIVENGKVKYKMTGCGDVPVKKALELLLAGGFDGYVSLEWVKRWYMDLEEPGIVFSHFANYMKAYK